MPLNTKKLYYHVVWRLLDSSKGKSLFHDDDVIEITCIHRKGDSCIELNLAPASPAKLWNYADDTASWGGNVVFDKGDNQWHLFFAEFLDNCGLNQWGTNSVVSHAVADAPQGPFIKKEVVLPAFHHNPTIAYDPVSEMFLLISIGNGSAVPQNCTSKTTRAYPSYQPTDPAAAGIITLWS